MTEKSVVEKVTSSLPVNVGTNSIAAFGATVTPLAAFIPFLVQSLASGRQTERLEKMFAELNSIIEAHSEQIRSLSDDQYKVINEAIAAAFYTVNEQKLELLRNAIAVIIREPNIALSAADALSRAIRDISADEAKFVVDNFRYSKILIDAEIDENRADSLIVRPGTTEEALVSGLISLGLVYTKSSSWDAQMYEWSPLVAKLIVLLRRV
ncbi:MAG: hypothetical protein Q8L93_04185 [Rhodocyclaceae bacterium]|nr:hypothetical protein [Rhodocyclaceae bacterium]